MRFRPIAFIFFFDTPTVNKIEKLQNYQQKKNTSIIRLFSHSAFKSFGYFESGPSVIWLFSHSALWIRPFRIRHFGIRPLGLSNPTPKNISQKPLYYVHQFYLNDSK